MAARRKNAAQANAPHSAPHTAPSPHPAPVAHPPADGQAAAVWAALAAAPGATAAQIATAARTSRAIAGRELAALETSGVATRTPGERKGRATAPATWQPAPCAAAPAPGTIPASLDETDPAAMAVTPAASSAPAGDGNLPGPDSALEPDETGASPIDTQAPGTTAIDAPAASKTAAPADDTAPGEDAVPDAGIPGDGVPAAGRDTAPVPEDGGPQPALAGEAAELLRCEVAAAATQLAELLRCEVAAAATQLAELLSSEDTVTTLAAIDAICAAAAHSRRLLKAASGRKPRGTGPAARPGQLRDLVQAHLAAHPDAEFTPHSIGRVLDRSSGAVANALDRLTALGHAQLTTDKPRRYRHRNDPGPAGTTT